MRSSRRLRKLFSKQAGAGHFELVGEISEVETIATGRRGIRDLARLRRRYRASRWRKLKGVASVRIVSGRIRRAAEVHWYEAHGLGRVRIEDQAVPRLMAATRTKKRYLLCVRNKGSEDVEPRKLYEQLPDPRAAKDGYVRVIDESGENYLYPADYFVAVDLPREAERALGGVTR